MDGGIDYIELGYQRESLAEYWFFSEINCELTFPSIDDHSVFY